MANNLSKKFALLTCSMMTMQALRLVISTAGFCVVRFHIDCSLFNIFISRLVNAVLMSQLFGNWLGDLFVFAFGGKAKLIAVMLGTWAEFACFCTAFFCICHTECGHLTGFYWSMVCAYFWWKVAEAPATSIAPLDGSDYWVAGFTLSGVWAAILKWIVMRCVADGGKTLHFNSDPLGDVNVSVVGRRSVKTTVDYRAAKWLFILTIVLTFLTCVSWSASAVAVDKGTGQEGVISEKATQTGVAGVVGIAFGGVLAVPGAMMGAGVGWVFGKFMADFAPVTETMNVIKRWEIGWGIVGALGGMAAGVAPCVIKANEEPKWVESFKWPWPNHAKDWHKIWAPMIGLGVGLVIGAITGLCIGACKRKKKAGFWAGALVGSFFGLWIGEMVNAAMVEDAKESGDKRTLNHWAVVVCGFLIVVLGLGTVYSIYPGMAPCSITQFKYFNIIDILILILSSIAPLVIMGVDLAEAPERLAMTIDKAFSPGENEHTAGLVWMGIGILLLISTNICEIIVLDIMQHPFSKMAQKVTTSGWRAVLLTVTMVTSQLVSTGVGFPCVVAGSAFNDGVMNANSTAVLWATECCGVLGEGYQTELKKYEPGMWPTQGMGKWDTYKWWNGKAFGNAWQIWCCIGTTDLRRDIMLCRQ